MFFCDVLKAVSCCCHAPPEVVLSRYWLSLW